MTIQDWLGVGISLFIFATALGLIGYTFYLVTRD